MQAIISIIRAILRVFLIKKLSKENFSLATSHLLVILIKHRCF